MRLNLFLIGWIIIKVLLRLLQTCHYYYWKKETSFGVRITEPSLFSSTYSTLSVSKFQTYKNSPHTGTFYFLKISFQSKYILPTRSTYIRGIFLYVYSQIRLCLNVNETLADAVSIQVHENMNDLPQYFLLPTKYWQDGEKLITLSWPGKIER